MKRLSIVFWGIILVISAVFFQNCTGPSFQGGTLFQGLSIKNHENGGGYSGMQSGQFFRLTPHFTCENHESPMATLEITPDSVTLIENKALQCSFIKQKLDPSIIDWSIYQQEVIGFREGIYEGKAESPARIPANLVEIWCRDGKDYGSIESLTYFDRNTNQAVSRLYYSVPDGSGGYTTKSIPDFSVARTIQDKTVLVKNSADTFELTVFRDQPSADLGLFNGNLKAVIEGQSVNKPTSCRLGGVISPNLWPARQIVDFDVNSFALSPKLDSFSYSYLNGVEREIRIVSLPTLETSRITGPDLAPNFTYSHDGKSLIYETQQNYQSTALLAATLSTGQTATISPPGNSTMLNIPPLTSLSQNKYVFIWGFPNWELYSANFDGTDLLKITPPLSSQENLLTINFTPDALLNNYVIASIAPRDGGTLYQVAVAIDGSKVVDLPPFLIWSALFDDLVFGSLTGHEKMYVLNVKTGFKREFPALSNVKFAKKSKGLLGLKSSANGSEVRATYFSMESGQESQLCPELKATEFFLEELEYNKFLVLTYDSKTKVLSTYQASATQNTCVKLNSSLTRNPNLNKLVSFRLSPDNRKVLAKLDDIEGRSSDLLYIPLDGKASYLVNVPAFKGSWVNDYNFLSDSRNIIFSGAQIQPGEQGVFLWTPPE